MTSHQIINVNSKKLFILILSWWLLSVATVWLITNVIGELYLVNRLVSFINNVPAVEKYALFTGRSHEISLLYLMFALIAPVIYPKYYQLIKVQGVLLSAHKWILLLVILGCFVGLTFGFDVTGGEERSFRALMREILAIPWLGASSIFILYYHCLFFSLVVIAKEYKEK